jgi:predicted transcriptional regulator
MSNVTYQEKRDKLDILINMLEVTLEPCKKTHILYKPNLNYYQLNKYLNELLELGLVKEIQVPYKCYVTTSKGKEFLLIMKNKSN